MLSRKSKKRLLRINLSQEKPKIKNSFSFGLQDLSENPELLAFNISLIITTIIIIANIIVFVANQRLKYEYKSKKASIQNYQNQLNAINSKISGIRSQYMELKEEVDSFKYENKIFREYHKYYKNTSSLINNLLSIFNQNYIYSKNFSLELNPNTISPSSINISINADSPKNASDILSQISYKNGCYDLGVKDICINSIVQDGKLDSNSAGFVYFNNNFELKGSIKKEVSHEK